MLQQVLRVMRDSRLRHALSISDVRVVAIDEDASRWYIISKQIPWPAYTTFWMCPRIVWVSSGTGRVNTVDEDDARYWSITLPRI
jgi:hypothetical protein